MPLSDVGINGGVVRTPDRVKSTARFCRRRNFRTRRPLTRRSAACPGGLPTPVEGPARLPRAAMWSRIDTEPTTTLGARIALFTLLTSSTMFLLIGRADDSVCVATRGWMLVGDLRWDMTAEWQRPTDSQLNG